MGVRVLDRRKMLLFEMGRREMLVFGQEVVFFGHGRDMQVMVFLVDGEMMVLFDGEVMGLVGEVVVFLGGRCRRGEMMLHAGIMQVFLGILQM